MRHLLLISFCGGNDVLQALKGFSAYVERESLRLRPCVLQATPARKAFKGCDC
jgi:hypothetical protein